MSNTSDITLILLRKLEQLLRKKLTTDDTLHTIKIIKRNDLNKINRAQISDFIKFLAVRLNNKNVDNISPTIQFTDSTNDILEELHNTFQ